MSHRGFGKITIVKAGICFILPEEAILKSGAIKKEAMKLINKCKTVQDAVKLSKYGFEITTV